MFTNDQDHHTIYHPTVALHFLAVLRKLRSLERERFPVSFHLVQEMQMSKLQRHLRLKVICMVTGPLVLYT